MNIDDEVSFCNRALFFKDKNFYEIVHRTRFIIVIEIAKQQICDKYIDQEVLIEFNKLSLRVKIYLIQDFQSNLIYQHEYFKTRRYKFSIKQKYLDYK